MNRIIITGANSGIGFYMIKELLKQGHKVAVLDIETDHLGLLQKEYPKELYAYRCDISKEDEVNDKVISALNGLGGFDYAIHNACKCTFDSFENTKLKTFHDVLDVNYFGAIHFLKAVLPIMKIKGKVFITSSGVGIMGFVNISPYASSKGALEGLVKCMNIEYKDSGITFHILHPPLTKTNSSAPLPVPDDFMADPEKVGTGLAKRMKSKRFIICHSFAQKLQTRLMYLFPVSFGRFLSKMTERSAKQSNSDG